MTTNFHTPYSDGVTEYKAADMNTPLGELDSALTDVSGEVYSMSGELGTHTHPYSSITGRPADDNFNTLSGEATADDADFIPIYDDSAGGYRKQLRSDFLTGITGGASSGEVPYDVGVNYIGAPTASAVLIRLPLTRVVDFDFGGGVSQAVAGTAATAETIFSIKKDGVEIGTCTFAAAGTTGTFSGETDFTPGEVITLVAPASPDATLADLGFVLSGVRDGVGGNGLTWVDRGDYNGYDYQVGDFTTDGAWHNLDLSGEIPVGAQLAVIRVKINDDVVGNTVKIGPVGYTNGYNIRRQNIQIAGQDIEFEGLITLNSARQIEYWANSTTWTTIDLIVKGWFI